MGITLDILVAIMLVLIPAVASYRLGVRHTKHEAKIEFAQGYNQRKHEIYKQIIDEISPVVAAIAIDQEWARWGTFNDYEYEFTFKLTDDFGIFRERYQSLLTIYSSLEVWEAFSQITLNMIEYARETRDKDKRNHYSVKIMFERIAMLSEIRKDLGYKENPELDQAVRGFYEQQQSISDTRSAK